MDGTDPVRGVAEGAGQAPAERQTEDRPTGLDDPEDHSDPQRARGSMPLIPMPTEAAKPDSPRDRATSSRASMR